MPSIHPLSPIERHHPPGRAVCCLLSTRRSWYPSGPDWMLTRPMAAALLRSCPGARFLRAYAFAVAALGCLATAAAARPSASVSYQLLTVAGVKANVVTVNLNDSRVRVVAGVARGFPGQAESWPSFLSRT